MYKLAPIVLFVYNRLDHTVKSVEALQKNSLAIKSDLIVYSDYAKNDTSIQSVHKVRDFIDSISGFNKIKIVKRSVNFGLAKSIISGVSEVLREYDKIIVLEDDLVVSHDFLSYMNRGLYFYKNTCNIFSITGANYPIEMPSDYHEDVFIFYRCSSWGWGTWIDRWEKVDWKIKDFNEFISNKKKVGEFNKGGDDLSDALTSYVKGKSDVWAIRWGYAHYINNSFCLYPVVSKVNNIGLDGSGDNCDSDVKHLQSIALNGKVRFSRNLSLNNDIVKSYQELFKYSFVNKMRRIIKRSLRYYKV